MPTGNSHNNNPSGKRLTLYVRLAKEAESGHLDDLECPRCRRNAVSVWFTHPANGTYRTWFICLDCDFHTRVQNTRKPRFFSNDRVCTDLEERDLAILRQSIFKKPPGQLM